jgi:hypothetical protein
MAWLLEKSTIIVIPGVLQNSRLPEKMHFPDKIVWGNSPFTALIYPLITLVTQQTIFNNSYILVKRHFTIVPLINIKRSTG